MDGDILRPAQMRVGHLNIRALARTSSLDVCTIWPQEHRHTDRGTNAIRVTAVDRQTIHYHLSIPARRETFFGTNSAIHAFSQLQSCLPSSIPISKHIFIKKHLTS